MIVALVTRVVAAVVPFRKKVQGRGRRRSGVMLAPRITRFLVESMGGLSVLDPARCPSIVALAPEYRSARHPPRAPLEPGEAYQNSAL